MKYRIPRWLLTSQASVMVAIFLWGNLKAINGDASSYASSDLEAVGAYVVWLAWIAGLIGLWREAAWGWWAFLFSVVSILALGVFTERVVADSLEALLSGLDMLLCGAILMAGITPSPPPDYSSTFS